MRINRRDFLKISGITAVGFSALSGLSSLRQSETFDPLNEKGIHPILDKDFSYTQIGKGPDKAFDKMLDDQIRIKEIILQQEEEKARKGKPMNPANRLKEIEEITEGFIDQRYPNIKPKTKQKLMQYLIKDQLKQDMQDLIDEGSLKKL